MPNCKNCNHRMGNYWCPNCNRDMVKEHFSGSGYHCYACKTNYDVPKFLCAKCYGTEAK